MPIAPAATKELTPEPPVTRHHNEPPLEERIAMEFRDALLEDRPNFLARLDEFVAAVDRAKVTDDETLGRAGDLAKMLRAAKQHVDETHKVVKQPYLDGGRAVDAEKNRLSILITDASYKLSTAMNEFMAEREAERRRQEQLRIAEERRQAELAAEAERQRQAALGENNPEVIAEIESVSMAAAAVKRPEPVRSDAGATVSGKTVWNSDVEDMAKAFRAVKGDEKVQQAIRDAVGRLVRAGQREIPGVRIWSTVQAVAR